MLGDRHSNSNALVGAFSGDGGAAQDDSIKASLDLAHTDLDALITAHTAIEMCVEKSDGGVLVGDDPLFTITGGPILLKSIIGIVTDTIGANATNFNLEVDVAAPVNTYALSTAVAIADDAIGTSYTITAATPGVFTPTTIGAIDQLPINDILIPIGTIMGKSTAANTGNIKWYLIYKPLSPNSVVVAAA